MTCHTYKRRHASQELQKCAFPQFDLNYQGNEGFIRPVRAGQTMPLSPSEVPSEGVHYLVQDLDGEWIALLYSDNPQEISAEIRRNKGVPVWMH